MINYVTFTPVQMTPGPSTHVDFERMRQTIVRVTAWLLAAGTATLAVGLTRVQWNDTGCVRSAEPSQEKSHEERQKFTDTDRANLCGFWQSRQREDNETCSPTCRTRASKNPHADGSPSPLTTWFWKPKITDLSTDINVGSPSRWCTVGPGWSLTWSSAKVWPLSPGAKKEADDQKLNLRDQF